MFNKKKCNNCGEKVSKNYSFCPNCGRPVDSSNKQRETEDWGMLGKNDFFDDMEIRLPLGFNTIFKSLVKSLDNQFKELDKELGKQNKPEKDFGNKINRIDSRRLQENPFIKSGGIRINITSSSNDGKPPKIIVKSFGNLPGFKEKEEKIKKTAKGIANNYASFSEENAKKLSKLPKKEPSTNIRRLNNKVIYEIDLPGVKSEKDISIIQLENSIEIKALGKDTAYFKLIPLNLPIKSQKLSKGKLVLELDAQD